MTVAELILKLKELDQTDNVWVYEYYHGDDVFELGIPMIGYKQVTYSDSRKSYVIKGALKLNVRRTAASVSWVVAIAGLARLQRVAQVG